MLRYLDEIKNLDSPHSITNPGVTNHNRKLYTAVRESFYPSRIALGHIQNNEFIKTTYLENVCNVKPQADESWEDPRLTYNGSGFLLSVVSCKHFQSRQLIFSSPDFREFTLVCETDQEEGNHKNWTLLPYTDQGLKWHRYLYPYSTTSVSEYKNIFPHWKYGFISGGSPAIDIGDDRFICFFHSANKSLPKVYRNGALLIHHKQITHYTPESILTGSNRHNLYKNLHAAFVSAAYKKANKLVVFAGMGDCRIGMFEVSISKLLKSMIEVSRDGQLFTIGS